MYIGTEGIVYFKLSYLFKATDEPFKDVIGHTRRQDRQLTFETGCEEVVLFGDDCHIIGEIFGVDQQLPKVAQPLKHILLISYNLHQIWRDCRVDKNIDAEVNGSLLEILYHAVQGLLADKVNSNEVRVWFFDKVSLSDVLDPQSQKLWHDGRQYRRCRIVKDKHNVWAFLIVLRLSYLFD